MYHSHQNFDAQNPPKPPEIKTHDVTTIIRSKQLLTPMGVNGEWLWPIGTVADNNNTSRREEYPIDWLESRDKALARIKEMDAEAIENLKAQYQTYLEDYDRDHKAYVKLCIAASIMPVAHDSFDAAMRTKKVLEGFLA